MTIFYIPNPTQYLNLTTTLLNINEQQIRHLISKLGLLRHKSFERIKSVTGLLVLVWFCLVDSVFCSVFFFTASDHHAFLFYGKEQF